jgi:hypothetical protein
MEVQQKKGSTRLFRSPVDFRTIDLHANPEKRVVELAEEMEVVGAGPGGEIEFFGHTFLCLEGLGSLGGLERIKTKPPKPSKLSKPFLSQR